MAWGRLISVQQRRERGVHRLWLNGTSGQSGATLLLAFKTDFACQLPRGTKRRLRTGCTLSDTVTLPVPFAGKQQPEGPACRAWSTTDYVSGFADPVRAVELGPSLGHIVGGLLALQPRFLVAGI